MKALQFFILLIGISSCIVEIEMDPPYVDVGNIDEYETREVVREVWSGGVLIYEEIRFQAWLDIEFHNIGGIRADDVWAEVIFYNGNMEIQTNTIYLPNIRSGNSFIHTMETGFESIYDYTSYDVYVYWE